MLIKKLVSNISTELNPGPSASDYTLSLSNITASNLTIIEANFSEGSFILEGTEEDWASISLPSEAIFTIITDEDEVDQIVELITSNAIVTNSIGAGPRTFVVTLSKSNISQAEIKAAIQKAEMEGNTVAGTQLDTNVVILLLQGAGITAGSNYGATGVTSAVYATFSQ